MAAHGNEPETAMPGPSIVIVAETAGDLAEAIAAPIQPKINSAA